MPKLPLQRSRPFSAENRYSLYRATQSALENQSKRRKRNRENEYHRASNSQAGDGGDDDDATSTTARGTVAVLIAFKRPLNTEMKNVFLFWAIFLLVFLVWIMIIIERKRRTFNSSSAPHSRLKY